MARFDERLDNGIPTAEEDLMGAFFSDPVAATQYARLGVGVWMVRPSEQIPLNTVIKFVTDALPFPGVVADSEPKFPTMWTGLAGPESSIASQDVVVGGLSYGLDASKGTDDALLSYHPERKTISYRTRVQDVGAEPKHGMSSLHSLVFQSNTCDRCH